jgi:hypothetical protein
LSLHGGLSRLEDRDWRRKIDWNVLCVVRAVLKHEQKVKDVLDAMPCRAFPDVVKGAFEIRSPLSKLAQRETGLKYHSLCLNITLNHLEISV